MKKINTVEIDGNGNIVIQNADKSTITIHIDNSEEIRQLLVDFQNQLPKHILDFIEVQNSNQGQITRTSDSNQVLDESGKKNIINKWNLELAKVWHNFEAPSRPSDSEIEVYRKYFKEVKEKYPNSKVLILGSTPEFRRLAYEEGLKTTIVDWDKEYYEEISNEFSDSLKDQIKLNETLVESRWQDMNFNKGFHIVIGDLALGNVAPSEIQNVIERVYNSLEDQGYFLGKTILEFENRMQDYKEVLKKYYDIKKSAPFIKPYAYTMYALTINSYDKKNGKVDFQAIYQKVKDCYQKQIIKEDILDTYSGERPFEDSLNINFYVYSYKKYVRFIKKHFNIERIEYSEDVYTKDFPLIICKKEQTKKQILSTLPKRLKRDIESYVRKIRQEQREDLWEPWQSSLTSHYFFLLLNKAIGMDRLKESYKDAGKHTLDLLNDGFKLQFDEKLDYIGYYTDSRIKRETEDLLEEVKKSQPNNENLHNSGEIIAQNYAYGLLSYITHSYTNSKNHAFGQVVDKLFDMESKENCMWRPYMLPWVTARICICLRDIPKEDFGDTEQRINEVYHSLIESVKELEISFDKDKCLWKSNTGNHVTDLECTALCLETFLDYHNKLTDENQNDSDRYKYIFDCFFEKYIYKDNIEETLLDLYWEDSIIKGKEIDKLIFVCILLKSLMKFYPSKEEFKDEKEMLFLHIYNFGERFTKNEPNSKEIINTNVAISSIPQILYYLVNVCDLFSE